MFEKYQDIHQLMDHLQPTFVEIAEAATPSPPGFSDEMAASVRRGLEQRHLDTAFNAEDCIEAIQDSIGATSVKPHSDGRAFYHGDKLGAIANYDDGTLYLFQFALSEEGRDELQCVSNAYGFYIV